MKKFNRKKEKGKIKLSKNNGKEKLNKLEQKLDLLLEEINNLKSNRMEI